MRELGHEAGSPPGGDTDPARIVPADCVTIANALCGFFAIVVVVHVVLTDPTALAEGVDRQVLNMAGSLILAGTVCDVADGAAARRWGSGPLGWSLDAMADVLTFGVAPAMLLAVEAATHPAPWAGLLLAAGAVYLVAIMIRLARNEAMKRDSCTAFHGVTSPVGGAGLLAVVACGAGPAPTLAATLGLAGLMVGPFRYPHQSDPFAATLLVAAWLLAAGALAGVLSLRVLAASAVLVILLSPLLLADRVRRVPRRAGALERRKAPA